MTILQDLAANGALPGAELRYAPEWFPADLADELFTKLRQAVPWETHRIRLFGRWVDSPRLSCWIGDREAVYTYSGTRFEPHPWPAALRELRRRLAAELGCEFNSVLANRYRDGRDYMGWHSDNEATLGVKPVIASVSLGASRRFVLKHRHSLSKLELSLPHGSLLVMAGETQTHSQHALPRTARPVGERINLTFRRVFPNASGS